MTKINGGTIIARADLPSPGVGFRQGEVILVSNPVRATSMGFVTAVRYGSDTSWAHGNYFDEHELALESFIERVRKGWGI